MRITFTDFKDDFPQVLEDGSDPKIVISEPSEGFLGIPERNEYISYWRSWLGLYTNENGDYCTPKAGVL